MTQGNRYCTGCGAPVVPGARFCSTCGRQHIADMPNPAYSAPVYQTSPAAESIIGVLPSLIWKRGFSYENLNVIVTNRRMVFAITTSEIMKQAAKEAGQGSGFWDAMLGAATVGLTFYQRYLAMPPDAALAENPQNFALELSQITVVRLNEGKEIVNYGGLKANAKSPIKQHRYENGKLEINTVSARYTYDVPNSSMTMAGDTLRKAGLYRG